MQTAIGVRAPGVAWCSDNFLKARPEETPLGRAPELCMEIVSPTNPLPKLREKAVAFINAGAVEAWIVHPQTHEMRSTDEKAERLRHHSR